MKVIDLLNKIANSEEVPKKIKYAGTEYEFSGYDTASKNYKCEYEGGFYSDLFSDIDGACLNHEIEILDEENLNLEITRENKIEKIPMETEDGGIILYPNNDLEIVNKINEIIEVINNEYNK